MENRTDSLLMEDGFERAKQFLAGDRSCVVSPVGTPGYALPELGDAEILPLTGLLQHPDVVVSDKGSRGNVLILARQARKYRLKIKIDSSARNNLVVIGPDSQVHLELDLRGIDGTVIIGARADWMSIVHVRLSSARGFFYLGERSKSNGLRVTVEGDGSSAIVGEDCMFATGTSLRTSDLHSIVQLDDDAWINPPENVLVEPHVWLGQDAVVLKGTCIGLGSIVAARAVVTRDVARFSIVGGIPAKLIKSGVSWDSKVTPRAGLMQRLRRDYRHLLG
jgi:acetyltransferase-like isoleucine patch superfamily enzyme